MPVEKKPNIFKIQVTDFLAIVLAILLIPLLIKRSTDTKLIQMATNMNIYSQKYYPHVKAPLITANIHQYFKTQLLNVPHMLFPGYDQTLKRSFIDAVAFTGIQTEMLYSQQFSGMQFKTPYVKHVPIYQDAAKHEIESQWKNRTAHFSADTGCSGKIVLLQQEKGSNEVVGITDEGELFVLDSYLKLVAKTDQLKIKTPINPKLLKVDDAVFLVFSESDELKNVKWNITKNELEYQNQFQLPKLNPTNSILTSFQLNEAQISVNKSFAIFRSAIDSIIDTDSVVQIGVNENYLVYKNKHVLHCFDKSTGHAIISFQLKPGVNYQVDSEDIIIHFVSNPDVKSRVTKYDLISQTISGDSMADFSLHVRYVVPVSDYSQEFESLLVTDFSQLKPSNVSLVNPVTFFNRNYQSVITILTPGGHLAAFDAGTGQQFWNVKVANFSATSKNAMLKVQQNANEHYIILNVGQQLYIYAADTGLMLGHFDLNVGGDDSNDVGFDENKQQIKFQAYLAHMHPFEQKKALVIVRGDKMDLFGLTQEEKALSNFWERAMLLILATLVIAVVLRAVIGEKTEKD